MRKRGVDPMLALSNTQSGKTYKIKWMFGIPQVLDFLHARQIAEGSTVHVLANLSGGLIIASGDRRIALDHQTAERIKV